MLLYYSARCGSIIRCRDGGIFTLTTTVVNLNIRSRIYRFTKHAGLFIFTIQPRTLRCVIPESAGFGTNASREYIMPQCEHSVGNVVVFTPSGKLLELTDYQSHRDHMHDLKNGGVRCVVFDLGDVSLVNSSGVSMLIACMKIMREAGGELRLANLNEIARKVMITICRLGGVFHIHDTVEDAVNSCSA